MGVNILILKTTNSMSHTLKVTAMETSTTVNSAPLFPCLGYMENFPSLFFKTNRLVFDKTD